MQTHDVAVRVKYDHGSDKLHATEITVFSTADSTLIFEANWRPGGLFGEAET
jgi:hypothetical protein